MIRSTDYVKWLFNYEDERPTPPTNEKSRSWVMEQVIGRLFFIIRRVSVLEHLKHLFWRPFSHKRNDGVPAAFVDSWIVAFSMFIVLMAFGLNCWCKTASAWGWAPIYLSVQVLQQNLFHVIWRAVLPPSAASIVHSVVRNVFLSFIAHLQVVWLFGLAYWIGWREGIRLGTCGPPLKSVWDAIYFSFVTSATVGYGDFLPTTPATRAVVVIEIVFSILMFSMVIARAVAVIKTQTDAMDRRRVQNIYRPNIRTLRRGRRPRSQ